MSLEIENVKNLIDQKIEIIKEFEQWISTQPHIPKNISRTVLYRYLKVYNFDLEKSKKLLDINVQFRTKNQYLFANRNENSDEFKRIMKTVQFTKLPKLSKEGYAIEVNRLIDPNPDKFILKDLFRAFFMIHDLNNQSEQIENGFIEIFDLKNFTFRHFLKVLAHPSAIMHFIQFAQQATCVDIKQVHLINSNSVISKLVSFLKPFFTKELYEKLHLHSTGFEALHELIDKSCLPVEFGGSDGSFDEHMEATLNNLLKNRDFICDDKNFFLLVD